jgi:hypothetical protein
MEIVLYLLLIISSTRGLSPEELQTLQGLAPTFDPPPKVTKTCPPRKKKKKNTTD